MVNKKIEKYLKTLGFKRKWLDDKSGYWLQKNIKNKFFNKCHITIENINNRHVIMVSCLETKDEFCHSNKYYHTIIHKKYSKKNINEVLKFLK